MNKHIKEFLDFIEHSWLIFIFQIICLIFVLLLEPNANPGILGIVYIIWGGLIFYTNLRKKN